MNVVRIILVVAMLAIVVAFACTPGEGWGVGLNEIAGAAGSRVNTTSDPAAALALPWPNGAEAQTVIAADVRFETVDLYVDCGDKPLAAYQVSLHSATGNVLLSGLEGGAHPAFSQPPFYDPKALIDEKVIIAAFSTADALPRGRTRVARLHVQVTGDRNPEYVATLQTSAGPDGSIIPAKVTVEPTVR